MIHRWQVVAITLTALLLLTPSVSAGPAEDAEEAKPPPGLWDRIVEMYEAAKEAGEQVPKDIYEWAQQDFGKIGDWEYKIIDLEGTDAATMETTLNELGAERWECLWIQPTAAGVRFVLKRPVRSYLKSVPLTDIMKFIPGKDSGSPDD